jgi:hypothetical protein
MSKLLLVQVATALAKSNKHFFTEDDIWEYLYNNTKFVQNGNDLFNKCCNSPLFEEQGFNSESGFLEENTNSIYCEPVVILRRSEKAKTPAPLMTQKEIEEIIK